MLNFIDLFCDLACCFLPAIRKGFLEVLCFLVENRQEFQSSYNHNKSKCSVCLSCSNHLLKGGSRGREGKGGGSRGREDLVTQDKGLLGVEKSYFFSLLCLNCGKTNYIVLMKEKPEFFELVGDSKSWR